MRPLIAILFLLLAAPSSRAQSPRTDLLMHSVYWQVLPGDVRTVKIDPHGVPWFELDGNATLDQIKSQIEHGFTAAPAWVKSARILLFDSAGRVWLTVGPDLLLAFDPASKSWIQRQAIATTPGSPPDPAAHAISGPAIEDNDGRIYIADRSGCHVFDHGQWTYQPFYQLNQTKNIYFGESRQFYIPTFAKDERGRIFAWTQWGPDGCTGTLGFWVHEGAAWHQTQTDLGDRPGRVSAIIPLRDGKVLLCPEMGRVAVARVDFDDKTDMARLNSDIDTLGVQDFRPRRDAEHRILQLGPHVLPDLRAAIKTAKSPEQRNRLERTIAVLEEPPQQPKINDFALANARLAGRDADGNAILWSDTVGPDGRGGRTAAWIVTDDAKVLPAPEPITEWAPHSMLTDRAGRLFLARYQKGLGVLARNGTITHLSDDTDIPFDEILGQDGAGRVYVRNRWHVAAVNIYLPDTRRTLPLTITELSSSRAAACVDSKGRTIAMLSAPDRPFLSIYGNGRFTDIPVPAGSTAASDMAYLQPMRNAALVAQEQPGKDVLYFDGQTWSVHRSFRSLVEKRFADLSRQIDNCHTGVDTYAGLRIDSRNNIWCVQWDHVDVFDGKQWQTYAGSADRGAPARPILYCLPVGHEGKVVLSDGSQTLIAELADIAIKAAPLPGVHATATLANGPGLHIDSRSRVWLPRSDDSATLIDNAQPQLLPDTGIPRLEDSRGNIWLINLQKRQLIILDRTGAASSIPEDALSEDSTVVEENPRSYWVNTRSGLRHFLANPQGKLAPEGDYYEKGLPKGACNAMWIDPDRALWFSGSGRLYRIQLP